MDGSFGWGQVAGNRQKSKHSGGQTQEDLSGGHVVPFPEKEGSWEGKHTVETEAEAEKSGSQLLPGDCGKNNAEAEVLECMARVGTVTRPMVLQGKATWDYCDQGEDLCLIMVWEENEFPTSLRGRAGETGKDQERKELRKFQPEFRETRAPQCSLRHC